jgi:hypothetical protein
MDSTARQTTETSWLFLLRLWREDLAQGQGEWRGQMTSLANGEVRYFRSPETLYKILLTMLPNDSSGISTLDSRGEEGESVNEANRQVDAPGCALPTAPPTLALC